MRPSSSSSSSQGASEPAPQEQQTEGCKAEVRMSSRADVRMEDRGPGVLALSGQGPESLAWPAGYRSRQRAKPWLSERCGVKRGTAAHPPFVCPQLLEQSSQSPTEGPQPGQGGTWYVKTGWERQAQGPRVEGLTPSREVRRTPGRGMRLVGKGKELTRRQDKPEREARGSVVKPRKRWLSLC